MIEDLSNMTEIASPEARSYTLHRRFDRFARLVGDEKMQKLFRSHVMIIGLGGVGSFAAESLIRSGIGTFTIIDFDEICITNSNRQLHAMTGVIGKKKAAQIGERLKKINPQATINIIEKFYSNESTEEIFSYKPDMILDCIDNLTAKCNLLAACKQNEIPVICSGGASAKQDPLQVEFADLSETHTDPFLTQVRRILRQKYNFPQDESMNIPTVFSAEQPSEPFELYYDKGKGFHCVCPQGQNDFHSCENRNVIYGTASYVTGTFGLVMASRAVQSILG